MTLLEMVFRYVKSFQTFFEVVKEGRISEKSDTYKTNYGCLFCCQDLIEFC